MIRRLELSASPMTSGKAKGRGLKIRLSLKTLVSRLMSFQVGGRGHSLALRVVHHSSIGTEAPVPGTLLDFVLCTSLLGCSSLSFTVSFVITV